MKPIQILLVLAIQKNSELPLNHIQCDTTDDESDTENTLLIYMLHIENEYETPIDSNSYQSNTSNSNPEEPSNNQNTI